MPRGSQARRSRFGARIVRPLATLVAAGLALPGCFTQITVREIDDASWFARESPNALQTGKPSERTTQFLRREGLLADVYRDCDPVLRRIHEMLIASQERLLALHLAELCFLASSNRGNEHEDEVRYLLSSVEYAYAYLFDDDLVPASDPYDPGFRWACDFYNRSLAEIVRLERDRRPLAHGPATMQVLEGALALERGASDYDWNRAQYTRVLVAFDYDVIGLPGRVRDFGLGVPLILVRDAESTAGRLHPELFAGDGGLGVAEVDMQQSFAATVVARFEGTLLSSRAANVPRPLFLELYDPSRTHHFKTARTTVPLEADLTTPLAYALAKSHKPSGIHAFFNVDLSVSQAGMEMFQRYDPKKIPVIFVHGLLSSPDTWMPLFNDLLADEELRSRFQFWFFRYPTGNPVAVSASLLRETLLEIERTCDPRRENPAFQDAVIVGHSMGGLLAKLQVLDGGDRAWKLVSDQPFDQVEFAPDQRELVHRALFFERVPFLKRAIFLATPHRGSTMATAWYSEWGQRLVRLPQQVVELTVTMGKLGKERLRQQLGGGASISGLLALAPDSMVAVEVSKWPFPDGLPVHSIIGDLTAADRRDGTDGIVPYASSHLDTAKSEKIVHSGHTVQDKPPTVLELIRILRDHLQAHDERLARTPKVDPDMLPARATWEGSDAANGATRSRAEEDR